MSPHNKINIHMVIIIWIVICFSGVQDWFESYWLCSNNKCRSVHEVNRGVCGNMLRVGRGRQPCGTNLKPAVRYPYRLISNWLIDLITLYRADNLIQL